MVEVFTKMQVLSLDQPFQAKPASHESNRSGRGNATAWRLEAVAGMVAAAQDWSLEAGSCPAPVKRGWGGWLEGRRIHAHAEMAAGRSVVV